MPGADLTGGVLFLQFTLTFSQPELLSPPLFGSVCLHMQSLEAKGWLVLTGFFHFLLENLELLNLSRLTSQQVQAPALSLPPQGYD